MFGATPGATRPAAAPDRHRPMILNLLASRSGAGTPSQTIRWRGEGVSRIEGLSDTVVGFAITLLVVKFLATFVLLTLPRAMLAGTPDALKQVMPLERLPPELETFDTGDMRRRWGILAQLGVFIVLWNAAVLATGAHLRARDNVFTVVYYGGLLGLVVFAVRRVRLRRRRAAERRALAERIAAP